MAKWLTDPGLVIYIWEQWKAIHAGPWCIPRFFDPVCMETCEAVTGVKTQMQFRSDCFAIKNERAIQVSDNLLVMFSGDSLKVHSQELELT